MKHYEIDEYTSVQLTDHQIEQISKQKKQSGEKKPVNTPIFAKPDKQTWGSLSQADWQELTPHQIPELVQKGWDPRSEDHDGRSVLDRALQNNATRRTVRAIKRHTGKIGLSIIPCDRQKERAA